MSHEVLVIDDDPVQRRLVEAQLVRMGFRAVLSDGGEAGLAVLKSRGEAISAVVLDLMMPGIGGLEVLGEMRRLGRTIPVVVQTARGSIDSVVEAMRAGAFDFVVKPVAPQKLRQAVESAVRVGEAQRRLGPPKRGRSDRFLDTAFSPAMVPVMEYARKAAASNISILIEGETGVGKEWLADAIRSMGPRAKKPFVAVNCGALPGPLVESILFGHEKGAFTDAAERRVGKFAEADGGTLFLDEVGELPLEAQVKLLRVLQTGEIDPVGGRVPQAADIRVISATNRCLAAEVRSGRFREDLYYRLNVFPIRIPPLRERRSEIARLADMFLAGFAVSEGRPHPPRITADAMRLLERHDWPGNIRQLENAIHRAIVLGDGDRLDVAAFPQIAALTSGGVLAETVKDETVRRQDTPDIARPAYPATEGLLAYVPAARDQVRPPSDSGTWHQIAALDDVGDVRTADDVEADLIRVAIMRYQGRMSEVARRLGIGRSTLYRKMRRYSIAENPPETTAQDEAPSLRETGGHAPIS